MSGLGRSLKPSYLRLRPPGLTGRSMSNSSDLSAASSPGSEEQFVLSRDNTPARETPPSRDRMTASGDALDRRSTPSVIQLPVRSLPFHPHTTTCPAGDPPVRPRVACSSVASPLWDRNFAEASSSNRPYLSPVSRAWRPQPHCAVVPVAASALSAIPVSESSGHARPASSRTTSDAPRPFPPYLVLSHIRSTNPTSSPQPEDKIQYAPYRPNSPRRSHPIAIDLPATRKFRSGSASKPTPPVEPLSGRGDQPGFVFRPRRRLR